MGFKRYFWQSLAVFIPLDISTSLSLRPARRNALDFQTANSWAYPQFLPRFVKGLIPDFKSIALPSSPANTV
jgi:hypothetical protein